MRDNSIEIEKKYSVQNYDVFSQVLEKYIKEQKGFEYIEEPVIEQTDYYYDTEDFKLLKNDCTLRIRNMGEKYQITVKKPIKEKSQNQEPYKRLEFQKNTSINNISENMDFINEYLGFLNCYGLKPSLLILNKRKPVKLIQNDIIFEMVFDDITYQDIHGSRIKEYQIEVELKSDYSHIDSLKVFTDNMEKKINGLIPAKVSKYKRGLSLFYSNPLII